MSQTTSLASAITAAVTSNGSPTPTGNTNQNPPNQSNPLLFFVALGFGVVFTNLWIIVGVKYCFRYNARNRARANGEDVDMQGMPRPHRRRREKKLMTMDEVNERFPATKYKTWRATREAMGMSTSGGMAQPDEALPVTARQSMQQEAREEVLTDYVLPAILAAVADPLHTHRPHDSVDSKARTSMVSERNVDATTNDDASAAAATNPTEEARGVAGTAEEDIPVAAVPDDFANTSGDTCAICIDNLEDNDDIRGLTCGHAFHTGCLDPWLSSRRACCPLCKADYYVPKPRSEAELAADEAARQRRRDAHAAMMARPGRMWLYRMQNFMAPVLGGAPPPRASRSRQPSRRQQPEPTPSGSWHLPSFSRRSNTAGADAAEPPTGSSRRGMLGAWRHNNGIQMNEVGTNTSPSDLEAGLNAPLTSIPEAARTH